MACAEEFIARNGYTTAVPGDPARLASESVLRWGSAEETLRVRHGSLESRAVGVCADSAGYGYTVVFRHRRSDQTRACGDHDGSLR